MKFRHRPVPLFGEDLVGIPPQTRDAFLTATATLDKPGTKPTEFARWARHNGAPPPLGRPTKRPSDIAPDLWVGYLRACNRHPNAPAPDPYEWIAATADQREYGRKGGLAAKYAIQQKLSWVVVVPRKDLIKSPNLEREWARKIFLDPALAKTHRISLRGVMRRSA